MPWISTDFEKFSPEAVEAANLGNERMKAVFAGLAETSTTDMVIQRQASPLLPSLEAFVAIETVDTETFARMFNLTGHPENILIKYSKQD